MKKRAITFCLVMLMMVSVFAPAAAFANNGNARIIVRDQNSKIIMQDTYTWTTTTNALEGVTSKLTDNSIPYTVTYGGTYIDSIDGIMAYDIGPDSGWMWSSNGMAATQGAVTYNLADGAIILFSYEKDWKNFGDFTDVDSSWAKDNIMLLKALGVVKGVRYTLNEDYSVSGEYMPLNTISRAEFAQILYNTEGDGTQLPYDEIFADVADGKWYTNAVMWAQNKGVINGFVGSDGNSYFDPNAKVTREDMAVMIERYAGDALTETEAEINFTDSSDIASYAGDAISHLQKCDVINGVANGDGSFSFEPKATGTRAELAAMISKIVSTLYSL